MHLYLLSVSAYISFCLTIKLSSYLSHFPIIYFFYIKGESSRVIKSDKKDKPATSRFHNRQKWGVVTRERLISCVCLESTSLSYRLKISVRGIIKELHYVIYSLVSHRGVLLCSSPSCRLSSLSGKASRLVCQGVYPWRESSKGVDVFRPAAQRHKLSMSYSWPFVFLPSLVVVILALHSSLH